MLAFLWRRIDLVPSRVRRPWRRGVVALLTGLLLATAGATVVRAATDLPHAPILNTTADDFVLPGTQPNGLTNPLAAATNCTTCHVTDITDTYIGSMMANSARDPLFRAALAVANQDAGSGGELCIRCHVPSAWLNGRSTPSDGSAFTAADMQGVTCSVCHRLVAPYAITGEASRDATERTFIKNNTPGGLLMLGSSALVIDRLDYRRGPFTVSSFHDTEESSLLRDALMCAGCHDIDNPLYAYNDSTKRYELDPIGQPASLSNHMFPVERTYSEWQISDFATANGVTGLSNLYPGLKRKTETADGPITVCQDCHMPMIQSENATGSPTRTLGLHQWAGGSAVWQTGIVNFWSNVSGDTVFNDVGSHAAAQTTDAKSAGADMLARAAKLDLSLTGDQLTVKITNRTGHKLPTGYAEGRRMWLQVRAWDGPELLYQSGVPQADGRILDPVKVYEIKQGITQAMANSVGRPDLGGEGFHFVLNNQVVKDNRIPPRGFTNAELAGRSMQTVGYNYPDGQYWDETVYSLPAGTTKVEVTLFYQTASGEYLDFLEQAANVDVNDGVDGQPVNWGKVVGDLRDSADLDRAETMAVASLNNLSIPFVLNIPFARS